MVIVDCSSLAEFHLEDDCNGVYIMHITSYIHTGIVTFEVRH